MAVLPKQTLYVNNLNDKINKDELKTSLYSIFTTYGRILDILVKKGKKMKGQAFITFEDIHAATLALRNLNKFKFYGKNMMVTYAKDISNVLKDPQEIYNFESKNELSEQQSNFKDKRGRESLDEDSASKRPYQAESDDEVNHILYLVDLPPNLNEEMLAYLFQQYAGFKEVRLVSGRTDLAFVEYETIAQAKVAKDILNNFMISPTHALKITYAKK